MLLSKFMAGSAWPKPIDPVEAECSVPGSDSPAFPAEPGILLSESDDGILDRINQSRGTIAHRQHAARGGLNALEETIETRQRVAHGLGGLHQMSDRPQR